MSANRSTPAGRHTADRYRRLCLPIPACDRQRLAVAASPPRRAGVLRVAVCCGRALIRGAVSVGATCPSPSGCHPRSSLTAARVMTDVRFIPLKGDCCGLADARPRDAGSSSSTQTVRRGRSASLAPSSICTSSICNAHQPWSTCCAAMRHARMNAPHRDVQGNGWKTARSPAPRRWQRTCSIRRRRGRRTANATEEDKPLWRREQPWRR